MTTYTDIAKPSGTSYTNTNAVGREQYDDPNVMFDDSIVFYDGINTSQYTNVAKPTHPTASIIVASYSESNQSGVNEIRSASNVIRMGNTFTSSGAFFPGRAVFNLAKTGSPTGTGYARIYNVSGGVPTTSVISSQAVSVATIASAFGLITFPFVSSVIAAAGEYAVAFDTDSLGASDYINIGRDTTSPTHAGQRVFMNNSSVWTATSTVDTPFYVYGLPSNYTKVAKPS